jgi:hypothetical protein
VRQALKNDLRPLAALLIVAVVLWIPVMRGPIDLRWDAGVYFVLGSSLAQGQGYRSLNEPGDPQAVNYPPLLPLVIAGHQRLLGTSDPVVVGKLLRVTFALMLLAAVAVIYVLARRWLSPWQAFTVSVIYLLSRHTYFLASLCFAEMPFTLVSLLFFLPRRPGWRKEIGAGACAIAAFLLRAIGIALLAAWVAESLIQRQWKRAALRAAVALLPVLLWQGYVNLVKASDAYQHPAYAYQRAPYQYYNVPYSENLEYLDSFRPELGKATLTQRLERVASNLGPIIRTFGAAVSWRGLALGEVVSWRRQLLDLGVSAFVILGLITLWRYGERLMILYLILSILIIAATPWPAQFARYFSPLVPFLAMAFVLGVVGATQQLSRHLHQKRLVSVGLALVAGIWVVSALTAQLRDFVHPDNSATYVDARGVEHPYRLFYYDNAWRDFEAALNWLRDYAPPGAVVASSSPHLAYLMLHSKTVMPPMESDVSTAQRLLDSVPVTFLIVDDLTFLDISKRYVEPITTAYGDRWEKVYTVPGTATAIYQRTAASSPGVR